MPNGSPAYSQPPLAQDKVQQIEALAQQGNLSPAQIADAVGTSRKTATKYIDIGRAAGRVPPKKPSPTSLAGRPIPLAPAGGQPGAPAGADFLVSVPKAFQMDTRIVFQAMEAAQNEWRWDLRRLTPGDFIDTVLFLYFRDRQIILSGYVKLGEGDHLVAPPGALPRRMLG
jgi:hypothetical protein